MSRREKIEIIKAILELCLIPSKKTNIVYKCNLNFNIVKGYLQECILRGWIKVNDGIYITTDLGQDYLNLLIPVLTPFEVSTIQNL
jgi:predicted transcriptional regulator